MTLAKLTIQADDGEPFEVHFNPDKISLSKSVRWPRLAKGQGDTDDAVFTGGQPAVLTLDLLFDSYERRSDVREDTRKIFHLTTVEKHGDLHRPPLCRLQWGDYDFDGYQWVLESLSQTFTLFLDNGLPARARLSCSFRQWRSKEIEARLINPQSADVAKTHTVRRGETLSSIARDMYNDPAEWRPIAAANGIHNPRLLEPGRDLIIPKLAADAGARRA